MYTENSGYKKELIDFLCYSYFGIIPEEWFKELQDKKGCEYLKNYEYRDYCLKMVIMKAYGDATMQKAYTYLIGKDTILKGKSDKARIMASEILFKELTTTESTLRFNDWHKKVCKGLVDEYKNVNKDEKPFFTYGNAQKWLNMTLKYLWLLGMLPKWIEETDLHIPIDSYILQAIKDGELRAIKDGELRAIKDEEKIDNEIKGSGDTYTYKDKAWSNLDNDEYAAFYEKYKGELESPLKWENEAWIKTAVKRKGKKTDKKIKEFFEKSEN